MIFRETFDLPGDAGAAAIGVLNLSAVLRSGLANVDRVVELADLDPEVNHDQAMAQLAASRATNYRHLRQARARVAATLVDRAPEDLQI